MNVLVTGATGHVGGAIVQGLTAADHRVVGLGRRAAPTRPAQVEQLSLDIGADDFPERLAESVEPCDAIVHCAAAINTPADAVETSRTNCTGTHNLIEVARRWKTRRFVFISGVAVLGLPDGEPFDEQRCPRPLTPYLASKLYGEHLIRSADVEGLSGVSLRLTSPVGPGLTQKRIFSLFVERALSGATLTIHGKGTRIQNYVDVRDVARIVETCLSNHAPGVFNVAADEAVSNVRLAHRCVKVLGSSSSIEFSGRADADDGLEWDVPNDRAKRTFGFSPKHTIEDSIVALAGR